MNKVKLTSLFPEPYEVGDKDPELELWPLMKHEVTGLNLIGYIYESINYSVIPGFMGVPYNLLVVIDTEGSFLDVQVLFHREPMFVGGVGEKPMFEFIEQYKGLSLMHNIKFNENQGQRKPSDGKNTYLDGISGATASIRILNQTLLSSALKVARARLGFGGGKDPDLIAKIDTELFQEMGWQALLASGLIKRKVVDNQTVKTLSVDARVAGGGAKADQLSEGPLIELYVMDLAIPTIGKNVLSPEAWAFLQDNLDTGDHAILVVSTGRYSFKHDNTLRGGISDRLLLRQEGLPVEMRDLDFDDRTDLYEMDYKVKLPLSLKDADWMVYKIIDTSGIDIALPLDFELSINGDGLSQAPTLSNSLFFSYIVPENYYFEADGGNKTWVSIWYKRQWDVFILVIGLVVLIYILSMPKWMLKQPITFQRIRFSYLIFTLLFIGWYAQGQLSIVNITGAMQALSAGGNLHFFLYDPMTLTLWIFVISTFFFWGRGAFCGWLCPFGAMQEMLSKGMAFFSLKPYEPSDRLDCWLKRVKYCVLCLILVAACISPVWTDRLVEIEPFKTSITLYFVRYWPFVLWAILTVCFSAFIYKGYCRYLCPLGAVMAIMGKFRLWDWLVRRSECGSPCQLCKKSCQYEAIKRDGTIDYDECFQCLDCVVIYENDTLCVPKIVEKRNGRKLKTSSDVIAVE
ncbi:4Fe-4S binding protein [Pontibacter sp. JAM-7]|uniref:4Fe-4S binding protein n=1 Tax=Pontibacter sp. JAM-7 TaxID=3366581 RepID=UPI003AF88E44